MNSARGGTGHTWLGFYVLQLSSLPLPDELGILQEKHFHYLGSSVWQPPSPRAAPLGPHDGAGATPETSRA